jgi:integrase
MSQDLTLSVAGFLAHKRALGRKYRNEEATLRILTAFASVQGIEQVGQLTPSLLEAFVASRPRPRPRSFNQLVGIVSCFLDWAVGQQLIDVSPMRVRRRREAARRVPFLFDTTHARLLLDAAADLPDNARATGRGPTYHTIFGLCYGLGLRAGEVCGLRIGDVDTERQLLVVRGGKFGKERLVPHGPRIGELVARHIERRHAAVASGPLFSFDGRRSVHPGTASHTFQQLVTSLNLLIPEGVEPPTLHHLRHSFAVGCLLRWYREGLDPSTKLYQLSTFMGHVDPTSTAVYLTITPALFAEANRRFETFAESALTETPS